MTPLQLRNLADALDALAKIRYTTGVTPGPAFDRPRISVGDDTWILTWVADESEVHNGHYKAEIDR